jgi:hypothetical protein
MRPTIALLLIAVVGCRRVPGTAAGSAPETPRLDMDITVRPLRAGGPEVTAIAVRQEIRGEVDQTRPLSLRIGIVYTSRAGIADRVDSLTLRDASGTVPFRIENDPENKSGYTYYRHWRIERKVQPPLIVTYRMRPVARPTGGPQYELYAHGGGISGHGSQLFVLPESLSTANIRWRWDLSDLASGSFAATTYGVGDLHLRGRPDTLVAAFYLAGPLGRYDPPKANTGFEAYWLGRPEYDSRKEMRWLFDAYENMRTFYKDPSSTPYRVFIRAVGRGGGTASGRSFMGAVPAGTEDTAKQAPRNTIAHEIGHFFVGGLRGGEGRGGTPWYGEGVNTHYTRLLLNRAGLNPVNAYLTEINGHARGYLTNPYKNLSNDSIATIGYSTGFGGASAQNLAYTRGSLFWGDVDERIRIASGGKRKLDDVIVPLLIARRNGLRLTQEVLFDALAKEVGPWAREHFDRVIGRGETLVPSSSAFGPCFRRKSVKYQLPNNGGEVDGYEWERVPSIPDEMCREW